MRSALTQKVNCLETANKLVYPADCFIIHPDFVESPEELQAKYESLHS